MDLRHAGPAQTTYDVLAEPQSTTPLIQTRSMTRSASSESVSSNDSLKQPTNQPANFQAPRLSVTTTALACKTGMANSARQTHGSKVLPAKSGEGPAGLKRDVWKPAQPAGTLTSKHPNIPSAPVQTSWKSQGKTHSIPQKSQAPPITLRSPQASNRAVTMKPKRANTEMDSTLVDRPAKRIFGGGSSNQPAAPGTSTGGPLKKSSSTMPKARRSVSAGLSSLAGTSSAANNAAAARRTSNIFQAPKHNPLQLPSSTSLMGLSPSKFGLTVPREFNFSNSPTKSQESSKSFSHSALSPQPPTKYLSSLSLAPSPLRSDEHVPRPVFSKHTPHATPNPSTSLSRSPAVSASLSGYDHLSNSHQDPVRSASPKKSQLYDMYRSPSRSPVQVADLMQRTLDRVRQNRALNTAEGDESDDNKRDLHADVGKATGGDGDPFLAVARSSQPPKSPSIIITRSPGQPGRVLPQHKQESQSPIRLPPMRVHPNQEVSKRLANMMLPAQSVHTSLGSPSKRPLSPEQDTQPLDRSVKARHHTLPSKSPARRLTRSRSARLSSSQVPRPSTLNTTLSRNILPPPIPTKAEGITGSLLDAAPTAQGGFKAPEPSVHISPVRSPSTTATSNGSSPDNMTVVSNTSSNEAMDMDTSVMSASGHASLANLQSLLSRMSMPRSTASRRSSSFGGASGNGGSRMNLLDTRAELEAEHLAASSRSSTRGDPVKRKSTAVPRYAAPTTSSSARNALLHSDHATSQISNSHQSTLEYSTSLHISNPAGDLTKRRISAGVPTVRRGSLLPLASSSSAGKNAVARNLGFENEPIAKNPSGNDGNDSDAAQSKLTILKDVVAFVDVKTAEGDEAGGVFVDILRSLGARVLSRPTDSITHIIYKGGKLATLHRYRAYKEPRPFLVGVGWIVKCRELNTKVEEKAFTINPDVLDGVIPETIAANGSRQNFLAPAAAAVGKRRRSLEPKILFPQDPNSKAHSAGYGNMLRVPNSNGEEIDRARRKSLQFAPRIGSPLKQRVFNAFEEDEEGIEED